MQICPADLCAWSNNWDSSPHKFDVVMSTMDVVVDCSFRFSSANKSTLEVFSTFGPCEDRRLQLLLHRLCISKKAACERKLVTIAP